MMNRAFLSAAVATLVVAYAPLANAATFVPGSPNFTVSGNIFSGPISANIGNSGIAAGTFQDIFQFTIPQTGVGSGSLSTSTSIPFSTTDTDITSVLVNGLAATKTLSADGLSEFFNISNVPITSGVLNRIIVNGLSRGNGSYGGNATFTPAPIPEPAAWAMMIAGFGLIGVALRARRTSTRVSFA